MSCMRAIFYLTLVCLITLSCSQEVKSCHTSADCSSSNTCQESVCVRKDVFPLNGKEVLATFISVVMNVVLNIGGVGGGAVHIPYIHLLYETTISKAVSISFACVFGASLGYVFTTIPLKDSITKRYLINYDINLITLPALMIGVGFGTVVSKFLSPLLATIIIMFVLGYAIIKNAFKFKAVLSKELMEDNSKSIYQIPDTKPLEPVKLIEAKPVEPVILAPASIQDIMMKNENEMAEQDQEEEEEPEEIPSPIKVSVKPFHKRMSLPASTILAASASTFDRTYSRVLSILVKDSVPLAASSTKQIDIQVDAQNSGPSKADLLTAKEQKFPLSKLLNLLVNVLSIIVFSLIRGTRHFKPVFGVQWSLTWDFVWFGLGIACFLLATIKSVKDVLRSQKEKQEANYNFPASEPVLNRNNLRTLLIRAVIGGFASAVSTLAGAFIVGPALTGMGMPAAFAAASTNMFMILSMFNAMIGLLLNGTLSIQEAAWFILFSCMFSVLVCKFLNAYVKKTGKESTIVGLILVGTIIGIMCLISTLMQAMVESPSAHVKFGSI